MPSGPFGAAGVSVDSGPTRVLRSGPYHDAVSCMSTVYPPLCNQSLELFSLYIHPLMWPMKEVHEVEPVMRPLGRTTPLSLLVVEEAVVV